MSCWTSICQTRPIYTACMSDNSCSLCQLTMTEIASFQKLLWFRNPIFKVQHQLAKGRYICKKNNILLTFSPHCFIRTPSLVINASVSLCSLCIFLTSSHFKKLTVNPLNSPQAYILYIHVCRWIVVVVPSGPPTQLSPAHTAASRAETYTLRVMLCRVSTRRESGDQRLLNLPSRRADQPNLLWIWTGVEALGTAVLQWTWMQPMPEFLPSHQANLHSFY